MKAVIEGGAVVCRDADGLELTAVEMGVFCTVGVGASLFAC